MKNLVFYILFFFLCCLWCGCSSQKPFISNIQTSTDSVSVIYNERTVFVIDTVFVDIPYQTSMVTTHDSASLLENDFSISRAWLEKGLLHHTLETKPKTVSVAYQKPITTITTESEHKAQAVEKIIVTKYVEKELSWWQKTCIFGFYGLIALGVLLYLIRRFRTHIP